MAIGKVWGQVLVSYLIPYCNKIRTLGPGFKTRAPPLDLYVEQPLSKICGLMCALLRAIAHRSSAQDICLLHRPRGLHSVLGDLSISSDNFALKLGMYSFGCRVRAGRISSICRFSCGAATARAS